MKKIDLDLKQELLEKIDELRVMIYNEDLDLDYSDFKKLKEELENVQDELMSSL